MLLLRLNLLFLLFVAFLPFPTRLVADGLYEHEIEAERVAVVVYGLTLLAIRLAFFVLESYARRAHLLIPGSDDADLQDERKKFVYVTIGYIITIVLGILVPLAAVVIYFALAIFLVIPFRALGLLFSGQQPDSALRCGAASSPLMDPGRARGSGPDAGEVERVVAPDHLDQMAAVSRLNSSPKVLTSVPSARTDIS